MALLTIKELVLGYESRAILKPIDFQVNKGDYLFIVGENGSGKSTLMRTILHLQPPVSGQVIMGDGLKANEIGYLPQQTLVQRDFPASVTEVVLSGCQAHAGLRPFFTKEDREKARRAMEQMHITELAKRCYRELSGGQQQRVLLSRALCASGKLLLLDEPVSGLDPKVTGEMYDLIGELHEKELTVIMISHDISAAVRNATHILHIGEKVLFATNEEYRRSEIGRAVLKEVNDNG